MNALALYVRYAVRSFLRGRSRSVFGAFCVAVGVASVVALGLVGANFQDSVSGNARQVNRGDVSVESPSSTGFTRQQYRYFAALRARGAIADYTAMLRIDAMIKTQGGDGSNEEIGELYAVDPAKFPFYDNVKADQPAGMPLARLLANPGSIAVSHDVFDTLHLHIGDRLQGVFRLGGVESYTVAGVVPDNTPDTGFGGGLFPQFGVVSQSSVDGFARANDTAGFHVYMKTHDAAQAEAVKADLVRHFGPLVNPKTVADVQRDSANSSDGFNKFFRIMGLVAVVIGGIGIINTMLVAVRRRTEEIAVLKSIGMKGRQVLLVFSLESLILGIAGTSVGAILGVLASVVVNNVTEGLAGYPIPWSLHVGSLVAGALVGIVGTVLFAYLPVVRASRVRPIAALRAELGAGREHWFRRLVRNMRTRPLATVGGIRRLPTGIVRLPKRQGVRTFLLVLALAALMGYLAVLYTGLVSGSRTVIVGVAAGVGVLVAAGVLTQLFVVVVWLISKLPSMGRLSVRMAFRSMGTQKRRLASTLLALCIGILAISSIAILSQNIKHEFAASLEQRQNFNVYLQASHDRAMQARVNAELARLPGIQHRADGTIANNATLVGIDGLSVDAVIHRALRGRHGPSKEAISQAVSNIRGLAGRDVYTPNRYEMKAGRNLDARDAGTDHAVVSEDYATPLGIKLGSHLVFAEGGHRVPLTVVGIVSTNSWLIAADTETDVRYMESEGLTTPSPAHNDLIFLKIRHADLQADISKLRRDLPNTLVLDLNSFMQFLKAIDKLALFPEIIAALSLFAGVIIIANTVALAMLERRKEIGVMKAVGARRRTILQFLLVENAIVGFLGSLAGVLLALLAAAMVDQYLFKIAPSFDWPTVAALLLLGTALAIGASALTALPASSEKPLRVLRYE